MSASLARWNARFVSDKDGKKAFLTPRQLHYRIGRSLARKSYGLFFLFFLPMCTRSADARSLSLGRIDIRIMRRESRGGGGEVATCYWLRRLVGGTMGFSMTRLRLVWRFMGWKLRDRGMRSRGIRGSEVSRENLFRGLQCCHFYASTSECHNIWVVEALGLMGVKFRASKSEFSRFIKGRFFRIYFLELSLICFFFINLVFVMFYMNWSKATFWMISFGILFVKENGNFLHWDYGVLVTFILIGNYFVHLLLFTIFIQFVFWIF